MDKRKVIESLIFHIEKFDSLRYPAKVYPRNFFYTFTRHKIFDPIEKYDPEFKRKINEYYVDIVKEFQRAKSKFELIKLLSFFGFSMIIFIIIGLLADYFGLFWITVIILYFFATLGLVILFYFFGIREAINVANKVNPKIDDDLKLKIQNIIDYTKKIFKQENFNPIDFPLYLRHDDYEGVLYEKKGKNKFKAYIIITNGDQNE